MSSKELETSLAFTPQFSADGLIPVVATDAATGAVLMLAYMNREALDLTLKSGQATYWSRSRQSLWRKGETSGHGQRVVEIRTDCDQDAIWLSVEQTGPACHTGEKSCFYRVAESDGALALKPIKTSGVASLFTGPLVQNNLRGALVEHMLAAALAPMGWRHCSGDWSGWDFENESGARLEVKQSAARQTWASDSSPPSKPIFDIAERAGFYDNNSVWTESAGRNADLYVFAWHPLADAAADHTAKDQWQFFLLPASALPDGQKTIGLETIKRLLGTAAQPLAFKEVAAAVEAAKAGLVIPPR